MRTGQVTDGAHRKRRSAKAEKPGRFTAADFGRLWPGAVMALIFVIGHYFYAAIVSDTALVMVMASAAMLAAVLLTPALRKDLAAVSGLGWPGLFFAMTISVALLTLSPWMPAAVHPIWAYSGVTPGAVTVDPSSTIIEIIKLLGMACLFVSGAAIGGSGRRAGHALTALLILGALLAAWALFGHVTRTVYETQTNRLEGHFLNPNTAGTFFAVLLAIAASRLSHLLKSGKGRSLPIALTGSAGLLFLACLLMTQSRGGFLAAFVGLTFISLASMTDRQDRTLPSRWIGLGVGALTLGALLVAGDQLINRFLSANSDAVSRSAVWAAHFEAFLASPWFGYGLGTSATVNSTLISAANYDTLWNIRAVLNVYLQWLEQAGLVGAIPMFLTIAATLVMTIRGWLRRERMRWALTGLLAVDIIFLVHGAMDFALEASSMAFMWAGLLGLQFGLARAAERP